MRGETFKMNDVKKSKFSIVTWLGIILCGIILFTAYIYKFNLSSFIYFFHLNESIGWTALETIGTITIGIFTIWISIKVSKIQEDQVKIESLQSRLYTEPHVLIDSFEIISTEYELSNDGKEVKSLKGIDYPFFLNYKENSDSDNIYVLAVTFVNTSEAFARLRFNEAKIFNSNEIISEFNLSTFGAHKNHIMLNKGGYVKVGLVINSNTRKKLANSEITISCLLDNNYRSTFKDEQSYYLIHESDGIISFMPKDLLKNTYIKIQEKKS